MRMYGISCADKTTRLLTEADRRALWIDALDRRQTQKQPSCTVTSAIDFVFKGAYLGEASWDAPHLKECRHFTSEHALNEQRARLLPKALEAGSTKRKAVPAITEVQRTEQN